MKSIKAITIIALMAGLFSVAMYITKNNHMTSVAAVAPFQVGEEEPNRALCDQLIRFGQVAFDRGQYAEAKHFFQKAITVDPGDASVWRKYNMALIAQISDRVQTDPSFLPEFSTDAGVSVEPPQISPDSAEEDDDGC